MKTNAILEKVNQQRTDIEKHGKLDPEVLKKINYKFRLDWNYYSNRMEGGTLTQDETRSVMVGNIDVKGKPFKDVIEMNGHDRTVLDILKLGKGDQRISEQRIKEIHRAIMHEDDPEKRKEIGEWKITPNEIINYKGEKIDFTPPIEVIDKVHDVLNKTNAELDAFFNPKKQSKHPLEIASQFHIDFVSIHPFYDGNGRTTRILMNIILVSCGYPPIIIKDGQKNSYYQLLADIQVYGGKANLFQDFVGERLIESQQIVLDAIAGKSIEEEDDFDKEIRLIKLKNQSKELTKSPKLILSTFKEVEKEIWLEVSKILNKSSELFSDSKIEYNMNQLPKKNKEPEEQDIFTTLSNLSKMSFKPLSKEIFGYDIYQNNIHKVEWIYNLYGLKGAETNAGEFKFKFKVEFNFKSYSIELFFNNSKLYDIEKKYEDYIYDNVIEDMKKILKVNLLAEIKDRT